MAKKRSASSGEGHLTVSPPQYLGRQAKVTWRKVVHFLDHESSVRQIDGGLVEMYVTQYEIYRNSYKHIREKGEVTAIYKSLQNAAGDIVGKDFIGYKRNPSTQIYDAAIRNLAKIGSELGLSPKSRSELLKISGPEGEENDDKRNAGDKVNDYLG